MVKETRIRYLQDAADNKYLPWQYYDLNNIVSIPLVNKRPFLTEWTKFKKTVHPQYIDQNIGLLCGKVSDITVVDVDISDGGLNLWNEISKNRRLNTPIVKSPSGGYHIYFKYNENIRSSNRLKINEERVGIDIRNNGTIIVAPPSIIDGKSYKWVISMNDATIKRMPIWLESFILNHT